MAVEDMLKPGEEDWKGALVNLAKRFDQIDAAVVMDTLRKEDGHAGRTAQALRKLAPASASAKAPSLAPAVVAAKAPSPAPTVAAKKAVAPVPAAVNAPTPTKAAAKAKEAPPSQTVAKASESPPSRLPPSQAKATAKEVPPSQPAPASSAASSSRPVDSKLIFVAALQADIQQITDLVKSGADINARYTGRPNKTADKIIDATPLHLVVTMGKANVAQALLDHGADFEAKMRRALGSSKPPEEQYSEMTPLHLAAMEGHASIVDMLLTKGADKAARMVLVERKGDDRKERAITPLEIANDMASKGHSRDAVISLLTK